MVLPAGNPHLACLQTVLANPTEPISASQDGAWASSSDKQPGALNADSVQLSNEGSVHGTQVLIAGKISQAAVLSAAAYEDEASFRTTTGIQNTRLVIDKNERNTHVSGRHLD